MTIGLVGIERTALAFLLALEELLVAVFLAGAKWVSRHTLVRANLNGFDTECLQRWILLQLAVWP